MYIIRCGVVTLGQFEKFKMATNVTENQPIVIKIKLVTQTKCGLPNMRSIMVLLGLCKDALFT